MTKVTWFVSLLLVLIMIPFFWYLYTDYTESEKVRLELEQEEIKRDKELERENAGNYVKMDQAGIDYINNLVLKDIEKDTAFGTKRVPGYTKEEAEEILGYRLE